MKKVLQRGFKPAKCKTALQMANSRLKILKNKKEIQIKHLRRELAQLLESGQTPTARIRVEHVVREEKTVAAYELIGIYCELLVVRLGVIESQKNCPIDLKEAVASVLFASQRLSDVPELAEINKQFTTKYGKDFATCAIELRPDSGVSRLLVEKLSAKAPDGPTKVKILMEIAAEHNVVWEAQSFVEPDPKDTERLSGASSFQPASSVNMDSSNKEQAPNVQAPAPVSVVHQSSERHHSPDNSYARNSSRINNVTSGKADDYYHPDARPSRPRTDEGECRNPNHDNADSSSRSKHRWETEFVDSTDAARAAAEAAERASFAARAAAELSSKERMTRQNSTESHTSFASANFRNEPSHIRNRSNVQRESFSEDYYSPRRNDRMQYEEMDRTRQDRFHREKESEIPPVDQPSDRHSLGTSRKNSSFGKTGREEQSCQDETDLNVGYSQDGHLRKQASRASSHSSNYSDENDYMKSSNVVEENIFATEYDHQSQSNFKDIDSHDHGHYDSTGDTFDNYGSYFNKPKFDAEDEDDHGVGFSLLGSKTPTYLPASTASLSFKGDKNISHGDHSSSSKIFQEIPSSPLFDDVSTSPPVSYHEPDPHTKFDNYGPNSESDDDLRHRREVSGGEDERVNLTSDTSPKSEVSDPVGHEFFSLDSEERKDNTRPQEQTDSESESQSGLGFGPLYGGFRNKKTLPPYKMTPLRYETSSKPEKEHNGTDDVGQSMSTSNSSRKDIYTKKASNSENRPSSMPPHPPSSDDDDSEIQLRGRRTETKPRSSYRHSYFSHDDSEEELPTRASPRSQERTQKPTTGMRDHQRTNFKTPAPASYEGEEEVEREVARVNARPAKTSAFSLRTKGQMKGNEKQSIPATRTKTDKESYDQSYPQQKTVTSSSVAQALKSPDPETPSRASHVHPNLPDCDDIFAKLGALRTPNRR